MMKKLLAILLLCLLPTLAHAQKTKATLTTEINTNLASGTSITATILRTTIIDIVNSYIDANGGSSLPCATHQWIAAIATLSSVTCTQPNVVDLTGFGTGVQNALTTNLNAAGGIVSPTPANAGDIIYWSGTDWALLAANNSGTQFLQETAAGVPSWATVAGSGTVTTITAGAGISLTSGATCTTTCTVATTTMVLLNTLTASTSATLQDTTSLTNTYSVYELEFVNLVPATTSVSAELQVHSGGAYKTTGYITTGFAPNGTAINSITPTTFIPLSLSTFANTGIGASGLSGKIRVYAPSVANIHTWAGLFMHTNGTAAFPFTTTGVWNTSGAVDGFQFLFSSGNITSGTINIYGIK
jgi:hypothetical protein